MVVIDPVNGAFTDKRNFDTWSAPIAENQRKGLIRFIDDAADGSLLMFSVHDAAGTPVHHEEVRQKFEELGSRFIRQVGSLWEPWTMIAIKGTGESLDESVGPGSGAISSSTLVGFPLPDRHGDTLAEATPVVFDLHYWDSLESNDQDVFRIDAPKKSYLTVLLNDLSDLEIDVLGESGESLVDNTTRPDGLNHPISLLLDPGTYFVRISKASDLSIKGYVVYFALTEWNDSIRSPEWGSTLSSSTVTFSWPGLIADKFFLGVATHPYQFRSDPFGDIYHDFGQGGTHTSAEVSGIPQDGRPVFVRLWYIPTGKEIWSFDDFIYLSQNMIRMNNPVPSSTVGSSVVEFEWSAPAHIGAVALGVDTEWESVAEPRFYEEWQGATNSRATVPGLALDGRRLFVRLWCRWDGQSSLWTHKDFFYRLADHSASMVFPTEGSVLNERTVSFRRSEGTGVGRYYLGVGTTSESVVAYPYGNIFADYIGPEVVFEIADMPALGQPVYVRLWSETDSGVWGFKDYVYVMADRQGVTPESGTKLFESMKSFEWEADPRVEIYAIGVGTNQSVLSFSPYGDIHYEATELRTVADVTGIPLGEGPIFARIWTYINEIWSYRDYRYETAR